LRVETGSPHGAQHSALGLRSEHRAGRLVVVGDSFLDVDAEGTATRLCPDAPVPVVDLARQWQRPGGAGLAALLAARAGAEVVLITALGHDDAAQTLIDLLADRVEIVALPLRGHTITKTRVAAAGVPLVRLDAGSGEACSATLPRSAIRALAHASAVLVSDYGRGVTTLPELRSHIAAAADRIPVVWDPHPRGQAPVAGCRLITPNAREATQYSETSEQGRQGRRLCTRWQAEAIAITVGPRGAILTETEPDRTTIVPVPADTSSVGGLRALARLDTCGAGDEFAATAALELMGEADCLTAVRSAVGRATEFVRAGAAASVSTVRPGLSNADGSRPGAGTSGAPEGAHAVADQVRRTGGRLIATGGCFDLLHPGHVALLESARALGDALIVCLNSDDSVRRAKGPDRPLVSQADRVRVLTALSAVDAVLIFDEDTPSRVLTALQPDVWVKGSDYVHKPIPEAELVERYGGEVVLLPLLSGYSTSSLVSSARRHVSHTEPNPVSDPISMEVS
jgi:D-beta-D-heptose 7-phosphate kinase / D-beta-D-heptose 1-phosphate adenosyltransferase